MYQIGKACNASLEYSSQKAKETLAGVLTANGLMNKEGSLVTDGGPENKGCLKEWLSKPGMLWHHLVAQVDIVQSNSMAEAANKIIKHQFLLPAGVPDGKALAALLLHLPTSFNARPSAVLFGLTPNEVIEGQMPDRKLFHNRIILAKKKRLATNQQVVCPDTC